MADIKFPLGRKAAAYYNTANKLIGDTGVETVALWLADAATVRVGVVRNMTLGLDSERADTNTRNSMAGGFMSETVVANRFEVTFDTVWDLTSTFLTDLVAAWSGQTRIALTFLNRDKDNDIETGDKLNGVGGNMFISLSKDENADDVQRGNWTATHADGGAWYEATFSP